MAIHYHKGADRFKDDRGRFVSKARAWKSSIARAEYAAAYKKRKRKKAVEGPIDEQPPPKPKPKTKPKSKPKTRLEPWDVEGEVKEYPDPDEWFPEHDTYGYEDLQAEWGEYEHEDTDS